MTSGDPQEHPFSGMNPYSAAADSPRNELREGDVRLPEGQSRGMISQVPILGVLMIIQGAMEVFAAIAIAGYAVFMPQLMEEIQNQAAKQGGQPPPPAVQQMTGWIIIGGAVLAVLVLIVGVLTIVSGFNVYSFKGRTLAIVSLTSGLLTFFTCYCFPTSVALTVYGLIVLLNPSVRLGFDLRSSGYPIQSIQRAFANLPIGR